jgi:hypothetical protein
MKAGDCVMSYETDLRTAIAYLTDLDAELEERSSVRDPSLHAPAREDMLYQAHHAGKLVANLEQPASNLCCMSDYNGRPITLQMVRTWCRDVEAKINSVCCGESAAAA